LHVTAYLNPISPLVFLRNGHPPEGNGHPLIQRVKTELLKQTVRDIGLIENDRSLEICFEKNWSLIIEPIERTPNLILTEGKNRTIAACYEIKPKLEPHQRPLVPGEKYRTLPAGSRIKIAEFLKKPSLPQPLPQNVSAAELYQAFVGLDWWLCRELEWKAQHFGEESDVLLSRSIATIHTDIEQGNYRPTLYTPPRKRGRLPNRNELPFVLTHRLEEFAELEAEHVESLCKAMQIVYDRIVKIYELERTSRHISKNLQVRIRRAERALEALEREETGAGSHMDMSVRGDLILASLSSLKKGMKELKTTSFLNQQEIVIKLNPRLTPTDNAELYYRKARKAKKKLKAIPQRREELQKHLEDLREAAEATSSAETSDALDDIARKFKVRYQRLPQDEKDQAGAVERFRKFVTSDGWTILVGKNDRENDYLTHTVAQPHDIWFHASGLSGSHVVLRKPHRTASPSKIAITEAAATAAYFSKGRKASRVPVIYTEKRHVRKFRKSKPGAAVCTREKLVMVKPKSPEKGEKVNGER
jgi:predicted ribosome quality control (RQC) complex YloA/Tae2 family protein